MPTKTSRGGHLKSHNRSASASTHNLAKHAITGQGGVMGYPHPSVNTNMSRTKSAEKIKRTSSDLQVLHHVKNVLPPPYNAYQQHPIHQTQSDHETRYTSKRRGITVLEVHTNSDGDDDEWVSSESGAVTPADNDEEEGPPTPTDAVSTIHQAQQPTHTRTNNSADSGSILNVNTDPNLNTNNTDSHSDANTIPEISNHIQPKRVLQPQLQLQLQAQLHPMTRTQASSVKQRTSLVPSPSIPHMTRDPPLAPTAPRAETTQLSSETETETTKAVASVANNQIPHPQPQTQLPEVEPSTVPLVKPALSQSTFPEILRSEPQRRPQVRQRPQSMADIRLIDTDAKSEADDVLIESPATEIPPSRTRPPSTRSMRSIYPHPLIRTRSYAPSTPTLTAPPAFSPTTASPTLTPSAGPGMIWGSPQSNTEHPHHLWSSKLKRQNSQSSVNSIATLPLTSAAAAAASAALAPTSSVNITATRERPRTFSHTSAALSSLAAAAAHQPSHHYGFGVPGFVHGGHQHLPSRPASPPLPVMFPPPAKSVHSMIPAALLGPHLSVTAHQRIMADSLMRIGRSRAEKAG
ncbi:hypothetical protein Clacol_000566 [Clathrus columnatus]|uniref:Uncharacterized protein n=1 Tax=Clathrus columnatus TaxID=1419009 RepID=A0AAV4ZXC6_9AGAM|nr:hypothetical protein Clacol_000566 [Clathrus columnatus]